MGMAREMESDLMLTDGAERVKAPGAHRTNRIQHTEQIVKSAIVSLSIRILFRNPLKCGCPDYAAEHC
jgi:hypothetical protein